MASLPPERTQESVIGAMSHCVTMVVRAYPVAALLSQRIDERLLYLGGGGIPGSGLTNRERNVE